MTNRFCYGIICIKGNPIAIRSDNGTVLVCMATEYYEQITSVKIKKVDDKEIYCNG